MAGMMWAFAKVMDDDAGTNRLTETIYEHDKGANHRCAAWPSGAQP
jgi:hypothetical protein